MLFEFGGQFDGRGRLARPRSEEHTSELQSRSDLVCRLLLEKKKKEKLILLRRSIDIHLQQHTIMRILLTRTRTVQLTSCCLMAYTEVSTYKQHRLQPSPEQL